MIICNIKNRIKVNVNNSNKIHKEVQIVNGKQITKLNNNVNCMSKIKSKKMLI